MMDKTNWITVTPGGNDRRLRTISLAHVTQIVWKRELPGDSITISGALVVVGFGDPADVIELRQPDAHLLYARLVG